MIFSLLNYCKTNKKFSLSTDLHRLTRIKAEFYLNALVNCFYLELKSVLICVICGQATLIQKH
jgi:hypothetical protein